MSEQQTVINSFSGEYAFLSNFWQEPVGLDGLVYPSVEHAFQASKTTMYHVRRDFTNPTMACTAAKRKGRLLSLRDDWEAVKVDVMLACLRAKFRPGYDLARRLLETGRRVPDRRQHVARQRVGHLSLRPARRVLSARTEPTRVPAHGCALRVERPMSQPNSNKESGCVTCGRQDTTLVSSIGDGRGPVPYCAKHSPLTAALAAQREQVDPIPAPLTIRVGRYRFTA